MLSLLLAALAAGEDAVEAAAEDSSLFELEFTGAQTVTTEGYSRQFQHIGVLGRIAVPPVLVLGELHLQNDDRYSEGHEGGYWLGANGTLEQGGLEVDLAPFSLRAGRFTFSDEVSSPYSLFVSSEDLGAMQLAFDVRTSRLFYSTRAIELTRDSARGYPDRGATIRNYGIKLGDLRVGFQDVIVYADRVFDPEYFLNPTPGFLLQYLKRSPGTPWATDFNHNSILGFFVDRDRADSYLYGQILIDDINFNRFIPRDDLVWNPDKIAWSLGGTRSFGFGTVGLYHAGATMYTFQAYGGGRIGTATDTRYGYTYYPDVEYDLHGEPRVIRLKDNYVGYLHGENNLAFMATYETDLRPARLVPLVSLSSSLELTISGSKSPANPWHEYNDFREYGEGTRLLDEERLETRVMARAAVSAPVAGWRLSGELGLGFVVNELELVDVPPELAGPNNEIRYFSPGTTNRPIASLRLSASYRLRYGR